MADSALAPPILGNGNRCVAGDAGSDHAPLVCDPFCAGFEGRHMPRPPKNKPVTNEIKYPYVVELAVVGDELDVELSQRIMQFHKSRHIQLRYGRRINTKRGKTHYRWRFSDLMIARSFAEQFGGDLAKLWR